MVCIYCTAPTHVVNSRLQRRRNNIWRRRKCTKCGSVFTTHEQTDLGSSLVFKRGGNNIMAFNRDELFVSIYESCKHRPAASADAAALTQTVIDKIIPSLSEPIVHRNYLIATVTATLRNFDIAAATIYQAYHPEQ